MPTSSCLWPATRRQRHPVVQRLGERGGHAVDAQLPGALVDRQRRRPATGCAAGVSRALKRPPSRSPAKSWKCPSSVRRTSETRVAAGAVAGDARARRRPAQRDVVDHRARRALGERRAVAARARARPRAPGDPRPRLVQTERQAAVAVDDARGPRRLSSPVRSRSASTRARPVLERHLEAAALRLAQLEQPSPGPSIASSTWPLSSSWASRTVAGALPAVDVELAVGRHARP